MKPEPHTRRPARRAGRFAALLVAAALLATACASDDDPSTATTTQPSSGSPAATSTASPTSAAGDVNGSTTTAAAAISAPAPSDSGPSDIERGGTLTLALANDPIAAQPRGGGSSDQPYVARQLFDSLLEQDPATGQLIPWLAESWDVNDDATAFTFHLRDDVTFSDGTPLTAQIVKDNFDDVVASGAKATWVISYFAGYQAATVVDEHTVTVTFTKPNAPFPQAVATFGMGIVGPATLAVPFEERATSNLVGTGPFVLTSYTAGSKLVLSKRAGYGWAPADRTNNGDAYLDKIVFTFIPEAGVRTGSLQSGQVDGIASVPPQDIGALRDSGEQIVARPNPGIVYGLIPQEDHAPLDDPRVRQAIAAAIDSTDVRDTVLSADFAVARSVLSQTTPGFVAVDELIDHDPSAAAALLDAAGWTLGSDGVRAKDGKLLHLVVGWVNTFGPNQAALELIQAQLADAGIDLELKNNTVAEFIAGQTAGAFDLTWGNFSRADGDAVRTLLSNAGQNFYRINDPQLEALLQQQLATGDGAARNELLGQIQRRVAEQAHHISVVELTTVLALDDDVHGVTLGADSRLHQLTDAWVES